MESKRGGNKQSPWSADYGDRRREFLISVFSNTDLMKSFQQGLSIPKNYGMMLDERVVEYPWVLTRIRKSEYPLLDAGSTLNYPFILEHQSLFGRRITIYTLCADYVLPDPRLTYVIGDFRSRLLPESSFETVVCISTLEHVGMDQTFIHNLRNPFPNADRDAWRMALGELRRLLRPGGRLLITLPFGHYEDHGWLQQFDSSLIMALKKSVGGEVVSENYYRYWIDGWRLSQPEECSECSYFNIHAANGFDVDYAAAARGVACLEFVNS